MGSIEELVWDGVQWLGKSYSPPINQNDRDNLVYGTYYPSAEQVGPIPGTSFTQLEPTGTGTTITLSGGNIELDGYEIWGEIRNRSADTVIRNSLIRGWNPDTMAGLTGAVKAYDQHQHIRFVDCKFDPEPWVTQRGASGLSPNSTALHGADYTLERCEIVNFQDGLNLVGQTATADSQYTEVFGCWIHKGFYKSNWTTSGAPSDRRTHSDAIQTNYIKNLHVNGCTLGGARVPAGYLDWENGYNAGEDFWNTVLMFQQEGTWGVHPVITNVLIENCLMGGGTSTINHVYRTPKPNTFADSIIRNIKFLERKTDWGRTANMNGGFDTLNGGLGRYVLRSTSIQSVYENFTILETGAAVPITAQADRTT